jgi:hypothetical protein
MNIREFVAGDTLDMRETVSGYPSSAGWELYHNLIPQVGTGTSIMLTATGTSSDHNTYYPSSVTSAWPAGDYSWFSWVTLSTASRVSIGSGFLTINPNPMTVTTATDNRSHARKVLDAIEATIEGRATHDMAQYMIQGRQVTLLGPEQLIRWRGYYQTLVQAEDVLSGQAKKSTGIRVHFRP